MGTVLGHGYQPTGQVVSATDLGDGVSVAARAALQCISGRVVRRGPDWVAEGDPMESALHCLVLRVGVVSQPDPDRVRRPYSGDRMLSSSYSDGVVSVLGAPEAVLARCRTVDHQVWDHLDDLTARGRRLASGAAVVLVLVDGLVKTAGRRRLPGRPTLCAVRLTAAKTDLVRDRGTLFP